jgi:hypothetical protein
MTTSMRSRNNSSSSNSVRISKNTLSILKNFSTVNSNLLVRPGNKISTIAPGKNMMAEAIVDETFETQFGIWDLNKFLGVVSLFTDPMLTFHEKYVDIQGADSNVKYFYSEPSLLTVPTKSVKMPETVSVFSVYQDSFTQMLKASSVLQLPQITFISDENGLSAKLHDEDDETSNNYTVSLGDSSTEFEVTFDMEHLRLLPGDYEVTVSQGPVVQFKNLSIDLTYWIAVKS